MKRIFFITFVLSIELCLAQQFNPNDIRLGDTTVNYVNPEISPIGNYIVWIEVDQNGVTGKIWQCGIDPNTGDLIPPNGKGYNPFYSTIYARPGDWGVDSLGLYYVGATISGQIKFVRPTSPTTAVVSDIPLPVDNKRRVFYPSQLPGINKRYVSYIWNDSVPGFSQNTPQNSYYQLRLLDLDNPANDYLIEQQPAIFPLPVPMDVIVPRWIKGTSYLTFGYRDNNNKSQAKEFNAFNPTSPPVPVTNDLSNKIDGYPVINPLSGEQYFMSGINASDTAYYYKRTNFGQMFVHHETVVPQTVHLTIPSLNQSHEPFFFNGKLYSAFQINNKGTDYLNTTLFQPGEIWMTTIDQSPQTMWLLSNFDSTLNVSEPEPYVGNNKVWVFYSARVIDTTTTYFRKFQLRRCDTPMNNTSSVEENNNSFIKHPIAVYPNPTKGIIHIGTGNLSDARITIYNIIGEVVKVIDNFDYVDLSDVVKGIYFVEVKTQKDLFRTKIIKQ